MVVGYAGFLGADGIAEISPLRLRPWLRRDRSLILRSVEMTGHGLGFGDEREKV